jgi:hypothetical protein
MVGSNHSYVPCVGNHLPGNVMSKSTWELILYRWEHIRTHFIQVRAHENSFYTGESTQELILYRWGHMRTHFIQVRTHENSFYTGKSTWELMLYRWKHTRTHFIQVKIFSKCWNDILTPFIFRGPSWSWSDGRWIYAICLSPLTLWVNPAQTR